MQFEITNILSIQFPIFGYLTLTITNLALYSIITLVVTLGLHLLGNNENKLIPSKWSIGLESLYTTLSSIVKDQIGGHNERYFPFVYSLFFFILIANLIGNVPYTYTITTSLIVSIGTSVTIFIGVTLLGLITKKITFFSHFVPEGCPLPLTPLLSLIELISYIARAFSLGIRLFANMVGGHSLLKILSTFLLKFFKSENLFIAIIAVVPFTIFGALSLLELAVSFIQSYVFTVLTCSYIREALESH
uniref:ATP synthase F0 subunit a n=1 Tax=Elmerina hispida TaxID=1245649 RepID=UPI003001758B|nr:ATP synthase F0 subunit a [Elmerina hispida]